MRRHQLLTLFNLSVVYLVWGSTFFAIKLALEGGLSAYPLIGLRFLLAGCIIYAISRLGGSAPAKAQDWSQAVSQSLLLLVFGVGLTAWSEQWLSSGLAALLVATSPIWVTIFDREQKLTAQKWVGLTLGLAGVGLLAGSSLSFSGQGLVWGFLGCMASAFSWAVGSLRARRLVSSVSAITRSGMQMICAGLILLAATVLKAESLELAAVTAEAWYAMLYLSILGSLLAYSSYTWLVANVSAALVSTHAYVNPVVAVLLGVLWGGEVFTAKMAIAAAMALVGVVVLMLPQPKPIPPALALVGSSQDSYSSQAHVSRRKVS